MTKNNKIGFKSNANIRDGTIDDVGKLSINDVKKLKDMFGPKRRNTTHKIDRGLNIPKDLQDLLFGGPKSDSSHMKGSQTYNKNNGLGGGSSIPSGMSNYRTNPPMITYDMSNAQQFANKSNLDEDKLNKMITNSINPMLSTIRDESKQMLLNEFKPYLNNFNNNNKLFAEYANFVKNDYLKFRDNVNNVDNEVRELWKQQPNIDEPDEPNINNIDGDDSGNFSTTQGSDNFINTNNQNQNENDNKSNNNFIDDDDDNVSQLSFHSTLNDNNIINDNAKHQLMFADALNDIKNKKTRFDLAVKDEYDNNDKHKSIFAGVMNELINKNQHKKSIFADDNNDEVIKPIETPIEEPDKKSKNIKIRLQKTPDKIDEITNFQSLNQKIIKTRAQKQQIINEINSHPEMTNFIGDRTNKKEALSLYGKLGGTKTEKDFRSKTNRFNIQILQKEIKKLLTEKGYYDK